MKLLEKINKNNNFNKELLILQKKNSIIKIKIEFIKKDIFIFNSFSYSNLPKNIKKDIYGRNKPKFIFKIKFIY